MSESVPWLAAGAVGAVVGVVLGWLVARWRAGAAAALATVEAESRLREAASAFDARRTILEAALAQERQAAQARSAGLAERISELQVRLLEAERDQRALQVDLAQSREARARLETELAKEQASASERLDAMRDAESRLTAAFAAASAQALDQNAARFLDLAASRFEALRSEAGGDLSTRQAEIAGVIAPMREALQRIAQTLSEVERTRSEDKGSLLQRLEGVALAQQGLQTETGRLVRALQVPHVRGRWGELQLQRVVELAGMEAYCDFQTQQRVTGDDGIQRPDMVITLPGGRTVVVDAKAPVTAYLDAINLVDDTAREARLRDHAGQVRAHITALGGKAYWSRFESTPDFVVLFLPGESFFSAAVQYDPGLFEYGVSQRVFLAGPFTLLALLRTVAHGWSLERLAENARTISDLAKDLYDRLASMTEHFADMRRKLSGAVEAHNQAIGSLEARVLPAARRFRELGVQPSKDLPPLVPIEQTPRRLQAADMIEPPTQLTLDAELVSAPGGALEPRADD